MGAFLILPPSFVRPFNVNVERKRVHDNDNLYLFLKFGMKYVHLIHVFTLLCILYQIKD
jgi:hypothetical protein